MNNLESLKHSSLSTSDTLNKALGLLPEPFQSIPEKYSLIFTQTQRSQQLARKVADATLNININPALSELVLRNLANVLKEHINDHTLLRFLAECRVHEVAGTLEFPSSPTKKAA